LRELVVGEDEGRAVAQHAVERGVGEGVDVRDAAVAAVGVEGRAVVGL
jgi:hypothetical protein